MLARERVERPFLEMERGERQGSAIALCLFPQRVWRARVQRSGTRCTCLPDAARCVQVSMPAPKPEVAASNCADSSPPREVAPLVSRPSRPSICSSAPAPLIDRSTYRSLLSRENSLHVAPLPNRSPQLVTTPCRGGKASATSRSLCAGERGEVGSSSEVSGARPLLDATVPKSDDSMRKKPRGCWGIFARWQRSDELALEAWPEAFYPYDVFVFLNSILPSHVRCWEHKLRDKARKLKVRGRTLGEIRLGPTGI